MQSNPDLEASLATLDHALSHAVAVSAPAVVRVGRRRGAGTGVAWTDRLIVTSSFHTPDAPVVGVVDGDGVRDVAARLVGRDRGTDLAVLEVDGGLTPIARRGLDGASPGQLGFALARPGRAIRASLRAIGVVGPAIRTPAGGRLDVYLETDRALPRGFAGGPLIDLAGRAFGMNTRTLVPGADLCVPEVTIARVVAALVADGQVAHGYLGVAAQTAVIPPEVSGGRGRGALIVAVEPDGPAARGGLLVGDVIVAIDGAAVGDPEELRLAVLDRPGAEVRVSVVRGGAPLEVALTAGARS
ncbi:MAG: PDZ domain-containing protein [Kofleriaceae bacterium]|jgi:S1-C subfamily serine protease|nr:PDZ domain-containing protein [Kofleriaceae bacterium]MBP9167209.1 PDZ domain-containing protein [Kofleriaceae bacterium]MBP9861140.1 PDZ domain-containing protein [Kofleriaceae bacterium]